MTSKYVGGRIDHETVNQHRGKQAEELRGGVRGGGTQKKGRLRITHLEAGGMKRRVTTKSAEGEFTKFQKWVGVEEPSATFKLRHDELFLKMGKS